MVNYKEGEARIGFADIESSDLQSNGGFFLSLITAAQNLSRLTISIYTGGTLIGLHDGDALIGKLLQKARID